MKLTKAETRLHDEAVKLLTLDKLNDEQKEFVFTNWRPGAENNIGKGGIFFTPMGMAWDAACFHAGSGRIVDACAGIGVLAYNLTRYHTSQKREIVCIEINREFVEVGRKLVPEATWYHGNAFDIIPQLDIFDSAICNPPFGKIPSCSGRSENFKGAAHFAILELILQRTKQGAIVILPDNEHSQENKGNQAPALSQNYRKWTELYPEAFITPGPFDPHNEGWHGTNMKCQICNLDTPNVGRNPYLK